MDIIHYNNQAATCLHAIHYLILQPFTLEQYAEVFVTQWLLILRLTMFVLQFQIKSSYCLMKLLPCSFVDKYIFIQVRCEWVSFILLFTYLDRFHILIIQIIWDTFSYQSGNWHSLKHFIYLNNVFLSLTNLTFINLFEEQL
jgi:hypothetical protein